MSYKVELESRARRELLALPKAVGEMLLDVLDDLSKQPRPPGGRKLAGIEGWRVRKSDYRVLYTIDDSAKLVRVYRIGHRSDVYRR